MGLMAHSVPRPACSWGPVPLWRAIAWEWLSSLCSRSLTARLYRPWRATAARRDHSALTERVWSHWDFLVRRGGVRLWFSVGPSVLSHLSAVETVALRGDHSARSSCWAAYGRSSDRPGASWFHCSCRRGNRHLGSIWTSGADSQVWCHRIWGSLRFLKNLPNPALSWAFDCWNLSRFSTKLAYSCTVYSKRN